VAPDLSNTFSGTSGMEQLGREDSVSKSVSVTIGMHSILSFSITGSPAFNGYEIC